MKKITFILLLVFLATSISSVQAQNFVYVSTPGTLSSSDPNLFSYTDIMVGGTIDARDFVTMCFLPNLTSLDLSNATIVSYTGMEGPDFTAFPDPTYPANTIPAFAFSNNINITSVILPYNVTAIDKCAFMSCENLVTVDFSGNLITIGSQAFEGCSKLSAALFPGTLKTIGGSAFASCTDLKSVFLDSHIDSIGGAAFTYSGLTSIFYNIPVRLIVSQQRAGFG
ncbi:MAG: leucine-rich repeat domain-containing protein [Paludibacteraceae bacterium]|nr:leucine-rich repeat domain-containing protein [Paludibacteraceae bacterium]MBN2787464.1 leucine-rich repeat domain-containing protein [Paludibacteraceae bacterium]